MSTYSEELIQKTKLALSDVSEVTVLYALVQMNKAIQDQGRKSEFPTISLYRDWLVHTDLDRNKRLAEFFKQWDEIIYDIQNGKGKLEATNKSQEALALGHLFEEMESLGINLEMKKKYLFINALMKAVIDAPLRWEGENVREFRFTYELSRKQEDPTYFCHMQFQLKQGRWFDGPELHF